MRRKIIIFFLVNLTVVSFLVHSFWPLICLLVEDGAQDQISRAEIPAPNSGRIEELHQVIPKIIHQTFITCDTQPYLNGTCATRQIPQVWEAVQNSCKELHKDYEYKFWTDDNSRPFIEAEYPWFVETWDSYTYPIERADAIRYFALEHFGGVYIDLDNGCQRRLDPLLAYPMWVRRSSPTGIGNDVIGAVPHHLYIRKVINSLEDYNRNWFAPYITIMASTGPLFFSLLWHHYRNGPEVSDADRVRILFGDEYMYKPWSFFSHHIGNSWHMWDAKAIFWMSAHWIEVTIFGFVVGFSVIFGLWWVYNNVIPRCSGWRRRDFTFRYSRMPRWRRGQKKDEEHELDEEYTA